MHNPRGHYNYLRLVSVDKYTVLVWFQYCNELDRRHEEEEEEV